MDKKLSIVITSEGTTAKISIIGEISEWNKNNASDMRQRCQDLKNSGISNVDLYLMTVGGDCFQGNEIVNILDEFFPNSYNGEGGALVASAGAYIAINCKTFKMVKNGQFMIHKPSGWAKGNDQDIENYLILMKNMTKTYYDAFVIKLKKKEADFKAKWLGGDFWMTAQEAVEWGFITAIKESVKIDETTASMIKACGCPNDVTIDTNINTEKNDMELKLMCLSVGLPADATQQQYDAKIAELKNKAEQFDGLKASTEKKEKDETAAKIKAALDKSELEKRTKADERKYWENLFAKDFDSTLALLEKQQPVEKLSAHIVTKVDGKSTYNGKTFEQLQDEDPDVLAALETENPEAFNSLFADWKKRNKIS